MLVLALIPPLLPYGPREFDPEIFGVSAPSLRHPLGTDAFGRDLLVRLGVGIRNAFVYGIITALSAITLGTSIGLVSGYFGGAIDSLLMRIVDIIYCLPLIPLMLLVGAVTGGMSTWNVVILLVVLSWAGTARIVRSQVLTLRERAYVEAAQAYGASSKRLIFRHLLPGVLPLSVIYMCFKINGVIFLLAALAFIGLGDPLTISLGMMLKNCMSQGYVFTAPWWNLPPGIAISLLSLGFYLAVRSISDVQANVRLRSEK